MYAYGDSIDDSAGPSAETAPYSQPATAPVPAYADPVMIRAVHDIARRHLAELQAAPAAREEAFQQQAEMRK